MQSAKGMEPPDSPVPAPLGTTLILFLWQYLSILETSAVVSGKITAIGFCL